DRSSPTSYPAWMQNHDRVRRLFGRWTGSHVPGVLGRRSPRLAGWPGDAVRARPLQPARWISPAAPSISPGPAAVFLVLVRSPFVALGSWDARTLGNIVG